MYSRGTVPPLIASTNSKPLPAACGSILSHTWPYWPRPPDCLMNLPSICTGFLIASRYATWGLPTDASTPNSRFIRSTMISRCSSPIPEMIVWPDSSSVWTRNDGSSCARRLSATPIFSWSALVFGSTACEITGSGNSIFSSVMVFFRLADVGLALLVLPLHRRDVHWRRQVVDHRIEHRLNALVLKCRAAQHRHYFVGDGANAQATLDFLDRKLVRLEVLVHELFI